MAQETHPPKAPRPKGERKKQLIQKGKHGLWRVIFSRTGIIVLLLLMQIALLLTLYLRFQQYMVHYFSVSGVLTAVMVLWPRQSPPGSFCSCCSPWRGRCFTFIAGWTLAIGPCGIGAARSTATLPGP